MPKSAAGVIAVALLLVPGCGPRTAEGPAAEGRVEAPAPAQTELPIFEHERSGHLPVQAIPGSWRGTGGGPRLELGTVDEVFLSGEPVGTYRVQMDHHLFEADVPNCRRSMRWDFRRGDLILSRGGPRCTLVGRWQRV